ncbi:glycosyltransferase family protein [Shimia marina]|uniref:Undecaprenyldiphospho-muramoylpentapeptide beta-N-acetylglucosaminyltransferase n=1 Tax=Shimia marina TaxID=321267 RepID=A0A0P1ELD6_9RHOB|nr:glycosyltransferase [Shimia marina]CUH51238.1 undecaprenyldiphospho-muramoylpentapeptide beta-N-acetylglucosaminyltransferase [Shimia marina]SFD54305.1 Predicted glycosyl transferase [Shimia marina]
MKVLIVVTHLLGTGHLSRALNLARAFVKEGHDAAVLSGGRPAPHLNSEGVPLIQLPPVASDGVEFKKLLTDKNAIADAAFLEARQAIAVKTVQEMKPDVVITELYPFGRRSLAKEFVALLETAKTLTPRPLVLSSVRDILEPPSKISKAGDTRDLLKQFYDGVLVHSDEELTTFDVSWPVTNDVKSMLRYTGYVAPSAPVAAEDMPGAGEIIVSTGGGSIGRELYECAIAAAKRSPLRWRLLVGGADKDARVAELQAFANDPTIIIEAVRPDFRQMLLHAEATVSMCGYNTALDVLQTGVPTVFVPFSDAGEVEQTLRARALASQPGIEVLNSVDLTPDTLLSELKRVLAHGRRAPTTMRMDGAAGSVRIAQDMLAEKRG